MPKRNVEHSMFASTNDGDVVSSGRRYTMSWSPTCQTELATMKEYNQVVEMQCGHARWHDGAVLAPNSLNFGGANRSVLSIMATVDERRLLAKSGR